MEGFWSTDEAAFRRKAREYFRRRGRSVRAAAGAAPEGIWRDLISIPGSGATAPSRSVISLGAGLSIIEEAARCAPRLGQALLRWRADVEPLGPAEQGIRRLGCLLGTAGYVLEAGTRAAREKGAFSSSLMGCREVQEGLAGLAAAAELLRLGTCRICLLLEKGDRDRAAAEFVRLDDQAACLSRELRAVAVSLLGERWAEANLPPDAQTSGDERNPP